MLMCIWIERDEQGLEGEGEKEVGGGVVTGEMWQRWERLDGRVE